MTSHPAALPRTARPLWLLVLLSLLTWLAACSDSSPPEPVISVQPSDASAVAGTAATLSVTASGPDIGYQWQLSTDGGTTWANVAGATQASHTTAATAPADNGRRYRVVVSASGIGLTSSAVTLTVTAAVVAPALTVQPAALTAAAPAAATFSVTVTGTAPGYQWQRSTDNGATWVNIAGATAASYNTGSTDVSMNASQYRVVVANSAGSLTSTAVVLSVAVAPLAAAFSTQPADQSVSAGSAAAFTVAATGNPTPTLQWQRSTDNGVSWSNNATATDATHNTGLTSLAQNGERYRALASNSAGSATSNVALLTVTPAPQAPAITVQPTTQSVTAPTAATFTAAASGVPTPTWQWQLSTDGGTTWANVNGATSASFSTPATTLADSGRRYRAVAGNSAGTVTSQAAILLVAGAVTGRAWQPAGRVETSNLMNQRPEIAFDPSGNALVVWQQRDSTTGFSIWANRYAAASKTWGAPAQVEPGTSGTAEFPQVAVDASGNAFAVWYQNGTVGSDIWSNRYTAATHSWGTAALIETNVIYAHIAVDSAGNALLVWNRYSGAIGSVWAKRHTAGTGWSTAARIETGGTNSAGRPQIAIDANGNALAVWNRYDGGSRNNIWANRYTAATNAWGTAALIETGNAGTAENPKIAIDANGNGVALWTYFDGARWDVMATQYSASTDTWGPAALSLTASAGSAGDMRVAFDGIGNATAVWDQAKASGIGSDIWANRYTAGVGWGTAALIETNDAGSAGDARIAIDGSGNALVVWRHEEGFTRSDIWANRYTAGVGWGTAAPIETADAGSAQRPQIAIDGNGNAIAVWEQFDGNHLGIWASRYR